MSFTKEELDREVRRLYEEWKKDCLVSEAYKAGFKAGKESAENAK